MEIKLQLSAVLVVSLLAISISEVASTPAAVRNGAPLLPSALVELGEADGKTFFADPALAMVMNQTSAAAHCESFGLQLATVETKNQVDMLNATLREHQEHDGGFKMYWTSAIEMLQPSSFAWGENGMVDRSLVNYGHFNRDRVQRYCLMFYPYTDGTEYGVAPCSWRAFALCSD